eukprot:SAG22_NODE_3774_length_1534_cov_4.422997_1_plen_393_part_00
MPWRPDMAVDYNSALAYSTVKIAKVHDWRLGALHYGFQFFIVVYIFGVVCLYNKEYLRVSPPEGTVRVGLLTPADCPAEGECMGFQQPATDLQYCEAFAGARPPGMKMAANYECRYADQNFAVWPPVEQRGVLVATRVTTSDEVLPAACGSAGGSLPGPECYGWETTANATYYVAQVENFTAFVDHTMTAASLGLALGWQSESMACRGIFDGAGNRLEPCDDYAAGRCPPVVADWCGPARQNILPVQTLLRAAGIPDLDTFGDFSCDPDETSVECESGRYAGLVLQVCAAAVGHPTATEIPDVCLQLPNTCCHAAGLDRLQQPLLVRHLAGRVPLHRWVSMYGWMVPLTAHIMPVAWSARTPSLPRVALASAAGNVRIISWLSVIACLSNLW